VKRGEVLAQLDTSDLQAALDAAQAQAEQAKAQWVLASSERRRTEALFARGFVGAQQLDRAKAGEEAAKRAWEAASAQVTSRRLMVAHATLKAPQDGVVVQWLVEPGQVVAAGQPAVRIALGAERELEVALPESLAAAAPQKGVAESPDGRRYALVWREQEGAVDPISRTLRARYRFADGTPKERPPILGEVWRVAFTPEDSRSVTAWRVPAAALDERGDGARVWRLARDGTVTPVAVTVERYGERDAVVQGPLAAGERIVAGGTHRLVAGAKVEAR
jgi:RND family efflux transporter MFP subunit